MRIGTPTSDQSTDARTLRESSAIAATSLQRRAGLSALAEGAAMKTMDDVTAAMQWRNYLLWLVNGERWKARAERERAERGAEE